MSASTWFMAALLVLAAGVALLGLVGWIRSHREDRSAATLSTALQPREPGREEDPARRDSLGWLERFGKAVGGGRVEAALLANEDRLLLDLVLLQEGERLPETPPRPPEVLADALKEVTLRYRGIDPANGQMSDWLPRWDDTRRLPLLVEVQIVPQRGAPWPPPVVAPRSGGMGGAR